VNDYRGGRFGFISGHATNSFGPRGLCTASFKHRALTVHRSFGLLLNSYTRIYLGVHFISDIIAE